MSAGERVPLREARAVGDDLVRSLASSCERIEIAGSVRRKAPDVGDLELVAISKVHTEPNLEAMWSEPLVIEEVGLAIGDLVRRDVLTREGFSVKANGERYRKTRHVATGLQVDLFTVRPPASWGCLFLIRTGPADYSHRFVTDARRRGFHFKDGQLHRGGLGCGAIACEVIPTPEEGDAYKALGLAWIPPEARR